MLFNGMQNVNEYCPTLLLTLMPSCCSRSQTFILTLPCSSSVCISLYETVTGSSEGEMPYHWYTDQRFALFMMCLIIILPLSIPKEIGIQKYTRYQHSPVVRLTSGFDSHVIWLFSLYVSVLGTLAASYLCVAVIAKYYLMESHTAVITPEHSQGSVQHILMDECVDLSSACHFTQLLFCVHNECVCVVFVFQCKFVGFNVQCCADHLLWLSGRINLVLNL